MKALGSAKVKRRQRRQAARRVRRQPDKSRHKTAIFANLRTFKAKFPLFSVLALWEPQTTIPENRPENLIYILT